MLGIAPPPDSKWLLGAALLLGAGSGCRSGQDIRTSSVLLVTVDTLRADHVGCSETDFARTPHFDALARRGACFQDAFTSVPVTLPAHSTLHTGRLPTRHGVRNNTFYKLQDRETTLAEILEQQGYRTGAVVGSAVLDRRFGLNQGFDDYRDAVGEKKDGVLIAERKASEVTRLALDWLRQGDPDRPFFLWVHYFDPHHPYRPPPAFQGERFGTPYAGEVAYVDREFGRLIAAVDEMAPDALIVLTSDHGEGLGQHREETHGIFLYDSTLRVPLIFAGPGIKPGDARAGKGFPVGLVDVLPTVAGRLGLSVPANVDGIDLFDEGTGREYLYAETFLPRDFYNWSPLRALRTSDSKFVQAPLPELYDLRADPEESRNLAPDNPRDVERWNRLLTSRAQDSSLGARGQPQLDAELVEQLASLGYVASSRPKAAPEESAKPRPDPKEKIHIVALIDRALALMAEGNREAAAAGLTEVLEDDPDNFLAVHTLADLLFELGRDREAIAAYQRTIEIGVETAYYHYRLALLHERLGQYRQAAEEFRRLLLRKPSAGEEVLARSDDLLDKDAADGSLAYLQAASAAGISGTSIEVRFARSWLALGEPFKALTRLDEALKAHPKHTEILRAKVRVLSALGVALGERGDLERALDSFRRALAIDGRDFESLANLGLTSLRLERRDDAVEALNKALEIRPEQVRLLNVLAELHFRKGEFVKARELLERSLRVEPNQPAVSAALLQLEGKAAQPQR